MNEKIIIALDGLTLDKALEITAAIGSRAYAVKVHELLDLEGPGVIEKLRAAGAARVWVDAKFYDIPNTARLRVAALRAAGADIISIHATGGIEMMRAAREGASGAELYAITVLTSFTEEVVEQIYNRSVNEEVRALAQLAVETGMDGIVCSAKELPMLTKEFGNLGMKFVTPGIRSAGADAGDQQRIETPAAALAAGATHIVIGRQITQAADPLRALEQIEKEIQA